MSVYKMSRLPSSLNVVGASKGGLRWPGLTGPPAVPGALEELRFHATVICSIRVSMGPIWGLLGGPGRRLATSSRSAERLGVV